MSHQSLSRKALDFKPWHQNSVQGLNLLSSPLLDQMDSLSHAFTTRLGGQTSAPYDSFNIGRHVKDESLKADALSNRKTLCLALEMEPDNLAVPGQVHSSTVKVVEADEPRPEMKAVDGLITSSTNLPLMLSFADCVPVMIYDRAKNVCGIFHAGWRGTAAKICAQGVELMISQYGSFSKDIVGAVGPAIGRCCYPTGPDVYESLRSTIDYPDQLFSNQDGQYCPDLKAINAMQLYEAGVSEVDISDWCTACNPEIFYSHRQSGGITGRQGAIICLK